MSYLKNTLLVNEKILYYTHPHPVVFTVSIVWGVLAVLLFIVGTALNLTVFGYNIGRIIGVIFLLFCAYYALLAFLTYISSEYSVTNKRVLMKTGLIARSSLEVILQRIESIHVEQSMTGRILDYGTVIICGTGGSKDIFYFIPKPLNFRRIAQEQIEFTVKQTSE